MARRSLAPGLARLLFVRGVCRAVPPLVVLWGMAVWFQLRPLFGAVYAVLTFNYVIVYVLTWTAPSLLNGPWRVRPWQTFILLGNAFVLPIVHYRRVGHWPWLFILANVALVLALYISTAILFHIQSRLPLANWFARRRSGALRTVETPPLVPMEPKEPAG